MVALLRNLLAVCRAVNASFGIAVPVFLEPKEVGRRDPAWTPLAVGIRSVHGGRCQWAH